MKPLYTVWVEGVEVNDCLLPKEDAERLAEQYREDGYDDVVVECVTHELCPHCGSEVELSGELKVQACPNCGKHIVTCSMCMNSELGRACTYDCCLEILARHLNGE